ncbi:MAG: hypothetical protein ABI721_02245 [Candidatus Dojkabacteria bacterium]
MGMIDQAKMVQKAMQARNSMSAVKAVGKGGSLGVIFNGLYATKEAKVIRSELKEELGIEDNKLIEKIARLIEKNVVNANEDARKSLEKELSANTSMDKIKEMLSGN